MTIAQNFGIATNLVQSPLKKHPASAGCSPSHLKPSKTA